MFRVFGTFPDLWSQSSPVRRQNMYRGIHTTDERGLAWQKETKYAAKTSAYGSISILVLLLSERPMSSYFVYTRSGNSCQPQAKTTRLMTVNTAKPCKKTNTRTLSQDGVFMVYYSIIRSSSHVFLLRAPMGALCALPLHAKKARLAGSDGRRRSGPRVPTVRLHVSS